MPTYLITDSVNPKHRVMVEAVRPQTALAALIANRFEVSSALDARDALRLAIKEGVEFIEADGGDPEPEPEPESELAQQPPADAPDEARPPLDAFTGDDEQLPDDAPEFAEVDEEIDPDIAREDRDERRRLADETYEALR